MSQRAASLVPSDDGRVTIIESSARGRSMVDHARHVGAALDYRIGELIGRDLAADAPILGGHRATPLGVTDDDRSCSRDAREEPLWLRRC